MMSDKLHRFGSDISQIDLPEKFTFPFYYEPHPIALRAVGELQEYLLVQTDFNHDFGLNEEVAESALGKMFGVLVVSDAKDQLGYLTAFSGKLGDQNVHTPFVPPVFDMLEEESYFVAESAKLDKINKEILKLEVHPELTIRKLKLEEETLITKDKIEQQKVELKAIQKKRKALRAKAEKELGEDNYAELRAQHNQESINDNFLLREYTVFLNEKLQLVKYSYDELAMPIAERKIKMKSMSFALQKWLFKQYNFLNIAQEKRNVIDIFKNRIPNVPPSGAGDCAAPKLFQYAFLHRLKPIALAEFWWGRPPNSNSRKHKYFYPACRGKCEPILGHMLDGIDMDPNSLLVNPAIGKKLETVYEDDHLLVINKPAEFMSVPGKFVTDSVQERLKAKYPNSTGPMIVHRLDMSTSGLMIVAKSKEVHKVLQEQFKTRKVKKRYISLLDGIVIEDEGYVNLPLRVDLDNRPYQIVCEQHGKSARTKYEVISRSEGKTRIYFYPITGRTHQLRVHASHHLGLNTPIIGDDLYGRRGERLCLHAEAIWFVHPMSGEDVCFEVESGF
ncbi:MAG: tRNA pseudouridine32 synthase/23S rRNA pseudouridine746 synthase [Saprospiraceae bacterium]|jgi:tRNA pseudouridine32 synthase/23S rRNA pseudouridine746 synthase